MKIALVFPYLLKDNSISAPLGILYLAGALKKEHTVKIIDTTFSRSFEEIEAELKNFGPEIVGISSTSPMIKDAFKAAKIAKKTGAMVALGGPHPTLYPDDCLKNKSVHFVMVGEGEESFVELAARIKGKKSGTIKGVMERGKKFTPRRPIENINKLEFPAFELLPTLQNYLDASGGRLSVIASRGCVFNCSYCQPTLRTIFGGKVRMRSPKNVVEEIVRAVEKFGAKSIAFQDDTFTWDEKWLSKTCGLINKKFDGKLKFRINSRVNTINRKKLVKLKEAGCNLISFGVESGSQRILDTILSKGVKVEQTIKAFGLCREIGIRPSAYIMLGNPSETKEDLAKTISLVKKIRPFNVYTAITTPLPKTKLHDICDEMGILKNGGETFCYRQFDSLPLKLTDITLEDIISAESEIKRTAKKQMILWLIEEYLRGFSGGNFLDTFKSMSDDMKTFIALGK